MKAICFVAIAAFTAVAIVPVSAQSSYPEKSIRLVYGFQAGNDVIERILADKLSEALGKPVVIDNVTGAGGNIAADRVAKSAPDGYTIGSLVSASITINASLYKKLPYDPNRDLIPIIQIYGLPNVLAVNNNVPAKTVVELIELARAQPGKISFGHNGTGTPSHLFGEILKSLTHIDIQEVPYRGSQQALSDLVSGQISMTFNAPSVVMPLAQGGKIRPLAVTVRTPNMSESNLPTMKEAGFPGFEVLAWFGLFAPAGTPISIVERLNRETTRIMALPDVRTRVNSLLFMPLGNTSAEFGELIKAEIPFWARVIKDAGIKQIE
jgi:tripartite-type tricarboxylate transporter receptor subunit TctC